MNDLLKHIMYEFDGSYINARNELILIDKTNLFFRLDDVKTDLDLKCKLLEWCSRDASKAMPYNQE